MIRCEWCNRTDGSILAEFGHSVVDNGLSTKEKKEESLKSFFERKGRRCPTCHKKVDLGSSAGGRLKRYHVGCEPGGGT